MTLDEIRKLTGPLGEERVTVTRNGGRWTGKVEGWVTEPAAIIKMDNGDAVVVVLDGATIALASERNETP